jgi:hypothetical protein
MLINFGRMLSKTVITVLVMVLMALMILPAIAQDGATTTSTSGTTTTTTSPFGPKYGYDATENMTPKDRSIYLRFQYEQAIITCGIDQYWKQTGRMPKSISDLLDLNLIPLNIVNPVTGKSIIVEGDTMGPGDIIISGGTEQTVELSIFMPVVDVQATRTITSDIYKADENDPADMRVHLYWYWLNESIRSYAEEYKKLPQSVDDLAIAGYWPFDGQLNSVSGDLLSYQSTKPGDFFLVFAPDETRATFFDSKSRISIVSWPPSELEWSDVAPK